MNNEKTENDRFYDPSNEAPEIQAGLIYDMTKGEFRPLQGPTEHMSVSSTQQCCPPDHPAKKPACESTKRVLGYMEYAPEPQNMIEANSKGLKFTVGTKYPILQKKEEGFQYNGLTFKTYNDLGTEVWIHEKYFIANPGAKLLWQDWPIIQRTTAHTSDFVPNDYFGSDYHKTEAEKISADGVEEAIDIRKLAKEKNIAPIMSHLDTDVADAADVSEWNKASKELKALSGVGEYEGVGTSKNVWEIDSAPVDPEYRQYETKKWKKRDITKLYDICEGTVRDDGNPIMYDANKCMAAISQVFGKGDIVDPDDLILNIKQNTDSLVTWKDGFLAIEGVKTKITYDEAQKAYNGLQSITTMSKAKKIVGKLLADKIKTLF